MQHTICIYCGAANDVSAIYMEAAREMGRLVGQRGHTLVYGAANRGLMGEAARSTRAHGGKVIGVIPQSLVELEQAYQDADEIHITDGLRDRKALMEARATGFVCLAGGLGTMDELFEALTLRQLRLHNKPIVLVDTNGYYQPFVRFVEHIHAEGFVKATYEKLFTVVPTVLEAVEYIEQYTPVEIESRF